MAEFHIKVGLVLTPVAPLTGAINTGLTLVTAKVWVTGDAASQVELPGCVAVIEQVPTARMVTVEPDTVHTVVVFDAKLAGSLELAVALIENGATPIATLLSGLKVMVCAAGVIVNVPAT